MRVLPRDWDGHRLLRFLAGLAMLALAFASPAFASPAFTSPAFTSHVTPAARPAPAVVRSVTAEAPAPVRAATPAEPAAPALPPGPVTVALLVAAVLVALPLGRPQRVHAVRGPPAA